ncbi:VirK/YbjX family protein [Bradyrhizobium paxllaeri]|uniref:VirK/YbjX family protein n=1 Tax=Bradyrhizobium paxllaeri TaxID=190148 RepID=UPI0016523D06|nr:DUF535 family protein [Bradyrhizobium paxllaeri]
MSKFVHSGGRLDTLRRLSLVAKSYKHRSELGNLLGGRSSTSLIRLFNERPETIGVLVWPYQCASWDTATRLKRLREHFDCVEKLAAPFNLGPNERMVVADLSFIRAGLRVVIDQPIWFLREGNLVINFFVDRVRMYSLAFSLYEEEGTLTATIGSIQGRDREDAVEEYRYLTKQAHGMRPRDFLFEVFCMVCSYLAIERVYAVTNEDRHHTHPYFGNRIQKTSADYNEIWEERGGVRKNNSLYLLSVTERRRNLEEIPQKKRGMYRKRYEMLDRVRNVLTEGVKQLNANPVSAPHEQFDL